MDLPACMQEFSINRMNMYEQNTQINQSWWLCTGKSEYGQNLMLIKVISMGGVDGMNNTKHLTTITTHSRADNGINCLSTGEGWFLAASGVLGWEPDKSSTKMIPFVGEPSGLLDHQVGWSYPQE